jgi:Spy/CpxP family protein refolding chaperone
LIGHRTFERKLARQAAFSINGQIPALLSEVAAMKQSVTLSVAAVVLAFGSAVAQTPYAGLQTRSIKALSDQQIEDLRAGRGMGLALAAELNGYPGPSHVLELADKLDLSPDQRASVQRLFDSMKAEAVPVGTKLVEQEADLDKQFADRTVTPESLKASTAAVATTQGALRETHLKYHLSTVVILTPGQMQRYAALRGYGEKHMHHHHQATGSVPAR